MKKILTVPALAVAATVLIAPCASATIHPIVESADCANATANENHPLGDVAEVPGQTPDYGSHSDTSSLQALSHTIDSPAAFGFKLDGTCGQVGR